VTDKVCMTCKLVPLVLCIPSANCAKRKLETANQLLYSRIMYWTKK